MLLLPLWPFTWSIDSGRGHLIQKSTCFSWLACRAGVASSQWLHCKCYPPHVAHFLHAVSGNTSVSTRICCKAGFTMFSATGSLVISHNLLCVHRSRPTWLIPQRLPHLLLRQQQAATLPLLRRRRRRPRPKRRKSLMRTWASLCSTRYLSCCQAFSSNAVMAYAVNGVCAL